MRNKVLQALAVFLLAAPLLAAEKSLTHETFLEMESVGSPSISPDGSRIIFTRGWVDQMEDRNASNLWITDINGQRVRELTRGNWRDSSPVWSPDGLRLAFISNRDESSQIHVMWLDTGDVAQLTHLSQSPQGLVWSPDGKYLAFSIFEPDKEQPLKVKLPDRPKGAKWAEPAVIIDRLNWRRDGSGPTEKGYTQVFVIDSVLGGTPRQVTSGTYSHGSPAWSPDAKTIYVSAIRKPDAEYLRGDSEIYAFDVETGKVKSLTERHGPDGTPEVSPDGQWIAYTGYDEQNFTRHLSSIYLMDSQGEQKRMWAGNLPNSPGGISWAADSSGIYYEMSEKGSDNLYFLSLKGQARQVTQGVHALGGFSVARNGQVAAVRSTFHRPGYLVTFKADPGAPVDGGRMQELVDVNRDVLEGVKLGDVEELWFTSKDGLKVQGWLVKPVDFNPGRKYPMLLYIHGGPWSMYGVGFNWAWQNFANEGYAVLYTNPRGSTGYGQDFVNGIQFSYPGKDYEDLMAGVDAAIARGFIDENNLFVCGGSGGGVLTAWIVGHTDRFAAAVSMRPVINWHSFVGTTDGASWYYQFEKYPWEDPMEYALRSPLHYVGNVTTPTMVLTGEEDLRTPMAQSEEYYRALKMLKKETLLVRIPDEYHGFRRPSHRLLQQLYLQAWFQKHKREMSPATQ